MITLVYHHSQSVVKRKETRNKNIDFLLEKSIIKIIIKRAETTARKCYRNWFFFLQRFITRKKSVG